MIGCLELAQHDLRHLRPDRAARALDPAGEPDRRRRAVGRGRGRRCRARSSAAGVEYELNEGDGAFYGPKIDLHMTDSIGRSWQMGTIQLDYQMPERFEITYTGEDNAEHRPAMVHRALFGSFERFIGILIEHFAGAFPLWLAPLQVSVLPVADRHNGYAEAVVDELVGGRDPGRGRPALGVGRAARSPRPSTSASPASWWSATARPRRGTSRCAAAGRATWALARSPSSATSWSPSATAARWSPPDPSREASRMRAMKRGGLAPNFRARARLARRLA